MKTLYPGPKPWVQSTDRVNLIRTLDNISIKRYSIYQCICILLDCKRGHFYLPQCLA